MASSLLSCQRDAYLTEGISSVLKCEEIVSPSDSAVKEYALTLPDSVLYPEGGGQVHTSHWPLVDDYSYTRR